MKVDISSQIGIKRPRDEVAAYAMNLDNARNWLANLKSVEWKTPPPLAVRSRIAFAAECFGRRLRYTYEIVAFAPGEHLVMRAARPFPMETSYIWESTADGGTRMTLRGRGEPTGLSVLIVPVIAAELRQLYKKDLLQLKKILESQG